MIFTFLSNLVHIVDLLTIFYMIFKENRSSKSIISWTLVLIILPYIGFILFLMLGRKVNTKDIFIMKKSELTLFDKYIKKKIMKYIIKIYGKLMIVSIYELSLFLGLLPISIIIIIIISYVVSCFLFFVGLFKF